VHLSQVELFAQVDFQQSPRQAQCLNKKKEEVKNTMEDYQITIYKGRRPHVRKTAGATDKPRTAEKSVF